jgi:hypothetical protein
MLTAVVTLTACGGDDGGVTLGSGEGGGTTFGGGGGGGGSTEDQEQAILDMYQCLRDYGLDVEDPDTSGGAGMRMGPNSGIDPENPEHRAALDECSEESGIGRMGQGGGGGNMADPEKLMDFVECMRENGIEDMPDPSAEGGLQMPDGINLDSEEFQAAAEACRGELDGGGMMVTQ